MEKILTISIALYNLQDYIKVCLESLISKKSIEKLEIFVVDDGGSDNSAQIAKAFAEKYPDSIKVITKNNGGWGSTVNYGIQNASGKYFKQLDGDDMFYTENIDSYIEYLESIEDDVIFTPYISFDHSTGKNASSITFDSGVQDKKTYELPSVIDKFPLAIHAMTFKTKLLQENNVSIMEHCFFTDVEYVSRAFLKAKTLSFYNAPIYRYRLARAGQSVSRIGLIKHMKEHEKVILTCIDAYEEASDIDIRTRNAIFERLKGMVSHQYDIYFVCKYKDRKEIFRFDNLIKEKYSNFYDCENRKAKILRNNKLLYLPLSLYTKLRFRISEIFGKDAFV